MSSRSLMKSGGSTDGMMTVGALDVAILTHVQGCRCYVVIEPLSRHAMVIDPHLDQVMEIAARAERDGLTLTWIVDTHTHADHPSGAARLAEIAGGTRVAHQAAQHRGVSLHPEDGERLALGAQQLIVRHAPGHTPDHIVVLAEGALFSGDSLLIGAVARTDFLGGDAGVLFDTIHALVAELPGETILFPGHDYAGKTSSTLDTERATNPWLTIVERATFVRQLTANPPQRPANMDGLLRLNREGASVPAAVSAAELVQLVRSGGAGSVIDLRSGIELAGQRIEGVRHIDLLELDERIDDVRATPTPRLLLCATGNRARAARSQLLDHGVEGLAVVDGGLVAYAALGGETIGDSGALSLQRQVLMVAGSMVAIGAGLALLVHPLFALIALGVGAGQVFAGVTDTCALGMLLARMPWNRRPPLRSSGSAPVAGGCAATAPAAGGGCAATRP